MINKVELYTSNYDKTLSFYQEIFKSSVHELSDQSFELVFEHNKVVFSTHSGSHHPFYHFAFLVPFHLFDQSKEYLKQFIPLNTQDGKDEISFKEGVRSLYFYDPNDNIVEFISHADKQFSEAAEFSVDTIFGLCEISLVTNNLIDTGKKLYKANILKDKPETLKKDGLTFISSGPSTLLLSPVGRTWVFSDKDSQVHPQIITIDNYQIKVSDLGDITVTKQ